MSTPKKSSKTSKSTQANPKKKPIRFKATSFDNFKALFLKSGQAQLSGVAMEGDPKINKLLELLISEKSENSDYFYANVFRFALTLNRSTYLFFEDPSDGYRSYLSEIFQVTGFRLHNHFKPLLVNVEESETYNHDVFKLLCRRTGHLICEIGTDNTDDYYPSCVAFFDASVLETAQLDNLPQAQASRTKMRL